MENLLQAGAKPLNEYSPLTLAFIGDAVYEMLVRELLVSRGSCPVKKLHSRAVEWVRCDAQAHALFDVLWEHLTEEEQAVATRGRNAHVGHVPKNASVADYHGATALEALFGYLYLKQEPERIRTLFQMIIEHTEGEA